MLFKAFSLKFLLDKMKNNINLELYFTHEPKISDIDKVVKDLGKIVGPDSVSIDDIDKLAYGKDYWLIGNRMTLEGAQPSLPDVIVWPKTAQEIAKIFNYANSSEVPIPVVPYGEGSGVVGAALSIQGGILIDMKNFTHISINEENMTVTAGTGINGMNLERYLNERGLRMGHIPQSVRTSTLGGYIAHRAAGQFSGKYGKMEDILLSFEVVLPSGDIIKTKTYPRASVGPMVDKIFLGSEGTLGIITEATCKIWPAPAKQGLISYVFPKMQDCLDAIRDTLQAQINPAVIRIYDKMETLRHFGQSVKESKDKIMVVFVCEGPNAEMVDLEVKVTSQNCEKYNGISTGVGPVEHWFETRFVVKEASEFGPYGLVFDTIEVACMWDVSNELYEKVCENIMKVPGTLMASGHASHFYSTGVCWYFTFGAMPKEGQEPIELYNKCWDAAVKATLKLNGAASHHHGIGMNRTRWMKLEHGAELDLMRKIKQVLDPNNILNPGKLYPESLQEKSLE
jgi:alkyldihydroxyacetonephosphate synthase